MTVDRRQHRQVHRPGGNLEETVTRNNLEAAEEIVRQLRLRDIGGIIVIDFIDMVLESNRDLVLRRLTECLGRDRTRHQVAEVTSLGLVQMTRKRVGQGLLEAFSEPCRALRRPRRCIVHTEPVDDSRKKASEPAPRPGRRGRRGCGGRGRLADADADRRARSAGDAGRGRRGLGGPPRRRRGGRHGRGGRARGRRDRTAGERARGPGCRGDRRAAASRSGPERGRAERRRARSRPRRPHPRSGDTRRRRESAAGPASGRGRRRVAATDRRPGRRPDRRRRPAPRPAPRPTPRPRPGRRPADAPAGPVDVVGAGSATSDGAEPSPATRPESPDGGTAPAAPSRSRVRTASSPPAPTPPSSRPPRSRSPAPTAAVGADGNGATPRRRRRSASRPAGPPQPVSGE